MLHPGARRLSVRHLSARVPWHDTAWDGRICSAPSRNSSCLVLDRVRVERNDHIEDQHGGAYWRDLRPELRPPCLAEDAGFMRDHPLTRVAEHPYARSGNPSHGHFRPTALEMPPYSVMAVPYRWMLKGGAEDLAEEYQLGYRPEAEEYATDVIGFPTAWVQTAENHSVLLDTFFSAIQPERSLVFLYAKATPLVDAVPGQRVLVGVGRTTAVSGSTPYSHTGQGELRSLLWEHAVGHSIRPGFPDGFLLPYHELLASRDDSEDLSRFVALAPHDHWAEFSYGNEQVTHDGAIASLLALQKALTSCAEVVPGPWQAVHGWIDERLNELWRMRGPCPGLGSALVAFGIRQGTLLAHRLGEGLSPNDDPWPAVHDAMAAAVTGEGPAQDLIDVTQGKAFVALAQQGPEGTQRLDLLRLLSRFALTGDQSSRFYQPDQRAAAGISASDSDLLANPYLAFESDRGSYEPVTVSGVDRGVFPEDVVRDLHPLPGDNPVTQATDPRRARALIVSVLEMSATAGHTLQPVEDVLSAVRGLPISPPCNLTGDLMAVLGNHLSPMVESVEIAEGAAALQLDRLVGTRRLIATTVQKRMAGKRHTSMTDWRSRVDDALQVPVADGDTQEEMARAEKAAALDELHAARLSVLIGPAGTGKTMLLTALCAEPDIQAGGVLLLTPTGKARVQLEQATGLRAQTIAQFLLPSGRFDSRTGAYRIGSGSRHDGAATVVIDESSMLTEEQLAATLDAVKASRRLILVGDPRQLPPIGAGRPFVDIVRRLRPDGIDGAVVRVGQGTGYCELTVHRRHVSTGEGARDDLALAQWFTNEPLEAAADEVWSRLANGSADPTIRLVRWDDEHELAERLLEVLVQELPDLDDDTDTLGFARSLGATETNGQAYYNQSAADRVADWQVLSPMRSRGYGVITLNRLLQRRFRKDVIAFAREQHRIPLPVGADEIVYGDKVLCLTNHRRDRWSEQEVKEGYVANGEIGIIIGRFSKKRWDKRPKQINVAYSSQPRSSYTYWSSDFGERGDKLELAYAITVHKAQGSQFGVTILVLPNPCPLLSPELVYTALTRQQQRVIVMHQGDVAQLRTLGAPHLSATAGRLTNLFAPPRPTAMAETILDANLLNRTSRGEGVRSKSEVIVANALHAAGIDYTYEQKLVGADGTWRLPDFTVEDADTGETFYWEHLGMLRRPDYRRSWTRKVSWYAANGVLPDAQGGGTQGTLLTTEDDVHGGIDSRDVDRCVGRIVEGAS